MDGLEGIEGVVVLAATNRPEAVDEALTRPGRFDRLVEVGLPDEAGRQAIFRVHLAKADVRAGRLTVELGPGWAAWFVDPATNELGVLPHVVEAILNHISGHKAGVAGVYNRASYAGEKRQALDLWAEHVLALAEGRAANVVPLRRA